MKTLWEKAIDMPPVWLAWFLVLIYFQVRFWNPLGFETGSTNGFGWLLILSGLLVMVWAFLQFQGHKTSVVPRNIPRSFIAKGPYRFSRNPIYLADAMVLLGFAFIQGSAIGIALVPVFMCLIHIRFIKGEEEGLKRAFPEEFAAFCARTRRWV